MTNIPWSDPQGLLRWVEVHPGEVTPLVLERLLAHFDFEEVGQVPTQTAVVCRAWRHKYAKEHQKMAQFRVWVYNYEQVSKREVENALMVMRVARTAARDIDKFRMR